MIYRMTWHDLSQHNRPHQEEEEVGHHVLVDEANQLSRVLGTSSSIAADSNIQALSNAEFMQYFDIDGTILGVKKAVRKPFCVIFPSYFGNACSDRTASPPVDMKDATKLAAWRDPVQSDQPQNDRPHQEDEIEIEDLDTDPGVAPARAEERTYMEYKHTSNRGPFKVADIN